MNSIIDEVLTKDSTDVNKVTDLDTSTRKSNITGDICESIKSTETIFATATEESKNYCLQEEEEDGNINTPTANVAETIVKTEECKGKAGNKSKTIIDSDKNIKATINKECFESKDNKGDYEPEEQTDTLSKIKNNGQIIAVEENPLRKQENQNQPSSEPDSEEDMEEIAGDQEIDEIILPDVVVIDNKDKVQFFDDKSLFEEDGKNSKIEEKMGKIVKLREKVENSGDNKSFLNKYLDDPSSKYSEEDETEFITLEEDELNKIRDLYKSTDKSTSINSNVFESFRSTEGIFTAAIEEFKGVCPQEDEMIKTTTTKSDETFISIQDNIGKAVNNSKTIVDNDKNIKIEDIEIPGDEEVDEMILPDVAEVEDIKGDKDKMRLSDEEILPEFVEVEYTSDKPKHKLNNQSSSENYDSELQPDTTNTNVASTSTSPYLNINSLTSSALTRKRQHEEDETEYTTDKSKAQEQQLKSDENSFIQSLATRSELLTTPVKRFKQLTKTGINSPTQRIRLNDTTTATVTSIEQYTNNNDAEDLLQATWIDIFKNDETQISDDNEAKKQQQETQQEDQYSSSSELPTICQPSFSSIPTSKLSERLYERNQEGIIIGDNDDNENNDNPSLVFPKNIDPQMFLNDEYKDRCVICNKDFTGRLVYHYVNEHRGCEIYNSRLSPSQIKLAKEGRCEVTNVSVYKSRKYYEASCIFCKENLRLTLRYWYDHFIRHTGEFAYRCTSCGLRKPLRTFIEHQALGCFEASVVQDYFFTFKLFPIVAKFCSLCNYVQLDRSNTEKHLHTQHNIKTILPEHIQTIVLLSPMTATSTRSKIVSRLSNKSDAEQSLPSCSYASNTYVIDNDANDNDVTFEKGAPQESPPQTIFPTINNTFEEFTNCNTATENSNNSVGSHSLLLASHAEKKQQVVVDDEDENNGNHLLVSALGFPKNFDPQMAFSDDNKNRCVICSQEFSCLVHHYVNEHRGCEIYNSRLSPSQIKLVKRGRCEVSNISLYNNHKYYEAVCIFCQKKLRLISRDWHQHFTRHTGEFAYRCTGCGLRKLRKPDFKKHHAQACPKAHVAQDYICLKTFPIEANVCNLCNYVQLYRSNIKKHLHMQHNIKQIVPEHIETIKLLSSTGSAIATTILNNSGGELSPSLLSLDPSNTCVINEDANDVTSFSKILPKETPSQINPHTINNTFGEFTKCHKATGDLNNSGGSPSVLLPSHAEESQQCIIIDDDDENNGNHSLVDALGFPKNVDPQMFINDKNKNKCVICNKIFNSLVYHYVNEHRGCEIYNSRLSPSHIKLVKQGRCEVSNVRLYNNHAHYEAFCIFCQQSLRFTSSVWYQHFTQHTGEFAYRCTGCNLRKLRKPEFKKHRAQGCPKPHVAQDYICLKSFPIQAKVCNLCNYVQLHRSNIKKHLHMQHNIKQIVPGHIQTIKLLSSTDSGIATTGCHPSLISSDAPNPCGIDDDGNDVTFDKILPEETPPQANPSTINTTCEEFTNSHKSTGDLNNSDGSSSLILSSHGEKNEEGIIIGGDDDNKNNDNPSLCFPKNVDPQMVINDENKDRCVICNQDFIGRLVHHYVNEHRGCEIYNSRLSSSQIKLIKQGSCGISNISLYKSRKYYEAFCIFCQENLRLTSRYWYQHFTRHTGEFAYRCTGCGLRRPISDFRQHQVQRCPKASVAQDYFFDLKSFKFDFIVCNLCNYVQLYRSNIEKHLHTQHNIKTILPEHIQTIALLSKPTSITASTCSKFDSRRSNKNDAVPSVPSSSHASNIYVIGNDDKDVTFEKIAPEESPSQTNPSTVNKTFGKFTNCHRAFGNSNNSGGSPSLLLPSHAEKNPQGVFDADENNENPPLVSALDFPKNVDTQMVTNDENKDKCVICNQDFIGLLVYHYVNEHPGCEIYNSRLSPSQIHIVKQGRCEVSNVSIYRSRKYYEAFCIFCQKNLRFVLRYWYYHFTWHTGEFAFRCTGCGMRKPRRPDVRRHQAQECPKARIEQDYLFNLKSLQVKFNVCNLCNYVQLYRSNIEKHLHTQHNIEQILPEHIQTIALLSIPTSMTATSTGSINDSSRGDEEVDEIILPDGAEAEDLTDDKDKEQLIDEQPLFESVEDEKTSKIEAAMSEKEKSKICDVDEKDGDSGDNKCFLNSDVQDLDDSSSKYSEEDEAEFISLEEDELNKIRDLYKSTGISTDISGNVFESFKTTEGIVTAATEEFKSVYSQEKEIINTTTTKIYKTSVNIQDNKGKVANNSKSIVDNDKNIKIEDIEIPGDEEVDEIILPDVAEVEGIKDDKDKMRLSDKEILPEGVEVEYTSVKPEHKIKNQSSSENKDVEESVHCFQIPQSKHFNTIQLQPDNTNTTVASISTSPYPNINSLTFSALTRKRRYEKDEDEHTRYKSKHKTTNKSSFEIGDGEDSREMDDDRKQSLRLDNSFICNENEEQVHLQHKIKQKLSEARKQKKGKSYKSTFMQSLATRSQRLATSVKRFQRSIKAGVNAPPQRILLNDSQAATVTSVEHYTENNDAEDLLQATWVENYETQISDGDESKKQQQRQQLQDHYSSSSKLSTISQPSPSTIPTSRFSKRLYERNQKEIIIGDHGDNEHNDNPELGFPKNIDPKMFINKKNKYRCVICNKDFNSLVYHYVNEHRGCEIYSSRLSPSQIKFVKKGRCEVSNVSLYKTRKYYEAFCIFCKENLCLILRYWYQHFTRHTGEFAYRCTGCGLRKPMADFRRHQALGCPKTSVAQDYLRNSTTFPIEANVCTLCNYVQLYRRNIEKHLHEQHNIEQISPEHIQTIVLLSIPSSIMITPTDSMIDSRVWNNTGGAASMPSSSRASNTYVIYEYDDDNDETFEKILPEETSPQTNPPTINNKREEFSNSHKSTGDLNNTDVSFSFSLPSHAEKNQEGRDIGGDDENNDNPSLVSALDWPKNVDPQMFIDDENKNRCVICKQDFIGRLVHHYVNEHRGCEIYNSRLSQSQIKLVKQGRCEVSNVSLSKSGKHYEAFCIFCQKNLRLISRYWYYHFTRHTGEFAYRCTGCGLRKPMPDFREHQSQGCREESVAQDYIFNLKSFEFEANVCTLCNYVQLYRSNIEKHLYEQHNIEKISPEHVQTILLLSIPSSIMITSNESIIDSRVWNNRGATSLPSSSNASNTYVNYEYDDDNDETFEKILPEETPSQNNPSTTNNRFEDLTNSHKSTGDLNNSDGSSSLILSSHGEKNQEGISIPDNDEHNDNFSLNSAPGFPKNVDPQMFIDDENKDRCVICNKGFTGRLLVYHYVNEHRGCEIYNSRLSPSQIHLVKQGRCEVSNVSLYRSRKFYEAFCIFCQKNLRLISRYWYQHFTRHTGEFAYRCTGCGLRRPMPNFRDHQSQANVCALCNYVQLYRNNIEKHLHMEHNIKEILPEHLQTIVLLSIPTSITASTHSKVDSRHWNKSSAASSLTSSSHASNTYVINNDDNDTGNDVSFEKMLKQKTPPQTNPHESNNIFEEFTNCHKAIRDLNNSDGSPSLLPSHAEKNQEGIIIGDDDDNENNDNPSLVSALDFPKNVDPQMFLNDDNKDRCVICNKDVIARLVHHYVNEHRGCEIYNSRLSPSQIKLVKEGHCEVSNVGLYNSRKYFEAFCIFCKNNLRFSSPYWYDHFTRHTGEFAYRCTGCGLRKPKRNFKEHRGCPKARVAQDYFRSSNTFLPIEAKVCNLCNYIQLHRRNIERHLHVQHNIKEIFPEHIQTIALLSIPKSITESTHSKIDSTRWNKSGAAPSLPSSSHASNTYVINNDDNDNGNDVSCEKMLKQETPPQTNPHESNNIFEEFTNCHKAIRDLNNSDGSSSLLPSHAEKNQEGIIIDDDDDNENNDNPSLVSARDFPKNVDPQMFINDENKDRCVICNKVLIGRLVHHYVNEHRGCEIYNSRLSPSQIKLVKQGRCEVSNVSLYKSHKYYEAFCVFCQKNLRLITLYWYYHFTRHTGKFAYRCTGCGLRKPIADFKKHQVQECKEASVAQDYFRSSKAVLPIEANVCTLCNYVQLYRNNIEKHLHMQHIIKEILPEHIQTIALLTKATSITSSTHSKLDSRRWNKSDAALSLPSSSHTSNTYVIDNDDIDNNFTCEKIITEETSPQANSPTINNITFEESINSHTVICSKIITLTDVTAADRKEKQL